jgi:CHAT domain-containing protein
MAFSRTTLRKCAAHSTKHTTMIRWSLLALLLALIGCTRGPNPEESAADRLLSDARALQERGDPEGARRGYARALAADEHLGRGARIGEELAALAGLAAGRADFDSAFFFYGRAIQQYRDLAQRDETRRLTVAVATLHRRLGQEHLAYNLLAEALRLARVFHDSVGVRQIELALLPSYRILDLHDEESEAINDLLRASAGESGRLATITDEVGKTLFFRRDYARAAEHFLRASTLASQSGDSLLASEALLQAGVALEAVGRTAEAFQVYSDAMKRTEATTGASSIRGELLTRVGNAYVRSRLFAQAKRFYEAALTSALKAGNKLEESYLALQLALCDADVDPAGSLRACKSVADFFRSMAYARGLSYALLCVGTVQERTQKTGEALQAYRSAVEQLEASRAWKGEDLYADCVRAFFGTARAVPYDALLDLLLRTGEYEEAFVLAQRKRAWEIRLMFGVEELSASAGSASPALHALGEAVAARVGAERQMASILENFPRKRVLAEAVRGALERSNLALAQKTGEVARAEARLEPYVQLSAVTRADLQRRLGNARALVWYIPTNRSLYMYVVSSSRVSVQVAALDRTQLHALVEELDRALRGAEAYGDSVSKVQALPDAHTQEVLRQLYEAFVRPLESDLAGTSEVLLVLPQEFPSLPVHALRRSSIPGTPYFAEQKLVSYLPSALWVRDRGEAEGPVKEVVGLGFAGTTAWDVEYELRDIRAFYKEARLYFGEQATMNSLRGEKGDLLHLAIEVRFPDQAPWNAAMLFSDGQSLTTTKVPLADLLGLPHFPVFVLSNLAPDEPGVPDAVAPLVLSNGARCVVVNTLTPSRKMKKFFGEAFYTSLLGGMTPARAFQKAQGEMIRNPEFSSPLVWSSYFLWSP